MISDDDVVPSPTPAADAPAAAGATATAPRPRRSWLVLLGALVVVALAVAVLQTLRAADAADERDALADAAADRQEATLVAAQFAEAFFTYDFEDVEASTDAVLALTTRSYAEDFAAENVPGLEDLFGEVALTSAGVPQEVLVSEVDGDTARALARVDIDTTVQGVDRTLADVTLAIDLRREGGEWRVDGVRLVTARAEGDTTSTTAPAPG